MSEVAQLMLPAIRWDKDHGYESLRPAIDEALELGVGGFILFGGERDAIREMVADIRARSRIPLLIGADLERGAGQQFSGAIGLPPLAAIASLGEAHRGLGCFDHVGEAYAILTPQTEPPPCR